MPDKYSDNPVNVEKDPAFDRMADDGSRFLCHTNVGGNLAGSTVSLRQLGPGAQIQRLIDTGAISLLPKEDEKSKEEAPPEPAAIPAPAPATRELPDVSRTEQTVRPASRDALEVPDAEPHPQSPPQTRKATK